MAFTVLSDGVRQFSCMSVRNRLLEVTNAIDTFELLPMDNGRVYWGVQTQPFNFPTAVNQRGRSRIGCDHPIEVTRRLDVSVAPSGVASAIFTLLPDLGGSSPAYDLVAFDPALLPPFNLSVTAVFLNGGQLIEYMSNRYTITFDTIAVPAPPGFTQILGQDSSRILITVSPDTALFPRLSNSDQQGKAFQVASRNLPLAAHRRDYGPIINGEVFIENAGAGYNVIVCSVRVNPECIMEQ